MLLIETLTDTPTLIAEGDSTRASRPLGNVLRGELLSAVAEVVNRVCSAAESSKVLMGGGGGAVVGTAVCGPGGDVLGVQVTPVSPSARSPEPQAVAGWEFVLPRPGEPLRTAWTQQFRNLYGIESYPELPSADTSAGVGLADLYRRVPRPADVAVLMNGVADAQPGDQLDGQLIARHDNGSLRLIRYVRRVVQTPEGLALRGIDHDITSTTTTGDLALKTLDSEIASTIGRVAGVQCALVDCASGFVIKWITEAPPGLDMHVSSGQAPIIDEHVLEAVRRDTAVVAQLPVTDKARFLVQNFRCIGHGTTAAALMMFTPIPTI